MKNVKTEKQHNKYKKRMTIFMTCMNITINNCSFPSLHTTTTTKLCRMQGTKINFFNKATSVVVSLLSSIEYNVIYVRKVDRIIWSHERIIQ
jgi:hypothetical protein